MESATPENLAKNSDYNIPPGAAGLGRDISPPPVVQPHLYREGHEDDEILRGSPDAVWFHVLTDLPWEPLREVAAAYYDALFHHKSKRPGPPGEAEPSGETREEASQRLLWERPTMDKSRPVLYEADFEAPPPEAKRISPLAVAPGVVPVRGGGPRPKCFFALHKSFLGASLAGRPPEPQFVWELLTSNPSFARTCGFRPRVKDGTRLRADVPSLRKLEEFDQIMRTYGLWDRAKTDQVRDNVREGVVKEENVVVGDTTHYFAFSGFRVVAYEDESGKPRKKSQSKTRKTCRCGDWNACPHPWEQTDEGAGTIVKRGKKMHWGHKASVVGLPGQDVPLDARCVADGATNDGQTFLPHVERLLDVYPEMGDWFDHAIYDAACDDPGTRSRFRELGLALRTSINPRSRKTLFQGLPRGMEKLTPHGNLVCDAGEEMEYWGARRGDQKFIYRAPRDESGAPACASCERRPECCPGAEKGRVATVPFEMLPHVDPEDPPMARRHRAMMKLRPSVERMIKRLKCDLGDPRLTKRGNDSFQAHLDKTLYAFHVLLRM
jgi:hypothetical protein